MVTFLSLMGCISGRVEDGIVSDYRDTASVRNHVLRLVRLQEALDDPRDQLSDAKREAKADGLNIDAINALLPLLRKYPYNEAVGVLSESIRYAEVCGTRGAVQEADSSSSPPPERVMKHDAAEPAKAEIRSLRALGRRVTSYAPLRLSTQVLAAVSLAIGLIWLLK